jgi:hypothetical protein
MGIGAAIACFAGGAILYWAVDVDLPYIDDDALGAILICAGALALAAAVIINTTRRAHSGSSVGTGIGLMVVGAIMYWAVNLDLPYVFDGALGVILMVAGAIAVLASVTMHLQGSRSRRPRHDDSYA